MPKSTTRKYISLLTRNALLIFVEVSLPILSVNITHFEVQRRPTGASGVAAFGAAADIETGNT